MSVLKDCWENIVGISRRALCVDEFQRPTDFNTSLSGLYLDELKGMNLDWTEDTGEEYFWEKIENAYENAVRTFKMDVIGEILKNHKTRYDQFVGNIGSQRFSRNLSLNNTYAGIRMYCNDIKGGFFTLKAIGVLMDKTETFDIDIYDNLNSDPSYTYTVQSIANKISITNITPIDLPLSVDNYDNLEYFFIYNRGTKQPKDNKPTCGCGEVRWCFDLKNPCFADAKATKDRWRQFAMIGGISGDDISIRENWGITQEMNGIVLIGEFNCDKFIYLCNEIMDFEYDPIGQAVAHALNYKWGEYVMDMFLDTDELTRGTTLGIEAINNNREFYNTRYNLMITFINENLDTSKFGCLSCKSVQNARISRQLL